DARRWLSPAQRSKSLEQMNPGRGAKRPRSIRLNAMQSGKGRILLRAVLPTCPGRQPAGAFSTDNWEIVDGYDLRFGISFSTPHQSQMQSHTTLIAVKYSPMETYSSSACMTAVDPGPKITVGVWA